MSGNPTNPTDRYDVARVMAVFGCRSQVALAELLDYPLRTVHRWTIDGLTHNRADHVACQIGMHPTQLWSTWLEREGDWRHGHRPSPAERILTRKKAA